MEEIKTRRRFFRQNYFRFKKLGTKWRKPRGKQSKMRKSMKGKSVMPNIGYRSPASLRGLLHGHMPVMVSNPDDLKKIKQNEIAVISSGVGLRKALDISKKAEELGVKIHNTRKVEKAARHFMKIEKSRTDKEKKKKDKKTEKAAETKAAKKTEKGGMVSKSTGVKGAEQAAPSDFEKPTPEQKEESKK